MSAIRGKRLQVGGAGNLYYDGIFGMGTEAVKSGFIGVIGGVLASYTSSSPLYTFSSYLNPSISLPLLPWHNI